MTKSAKIVVLSAAISAFLVLYSIHATYADVIERAAHPSAADAEYLDELLPGRSLLGRRGAAHVVEVASLSDDIVPVDDGQELVDLIDEDNDEGDDDEIAVPGVGHGKAEPPRLTGPVRFVVIASQRTGSTLLCNLIAAAPGAHCAQEIFLDWSLQTLAGFPASYGLRNIREEWPVYRQVLDLGTRSALEVRQLRDRGGDAALKDDIDAGASALRIDGRVRGVDGARAPQLYERERWQDSRVMGFKIQYDQLPHDQPIGTLFDYCERHDVRIIHLMRRSTLDIFASRQAAQSTGVFIINDASKQFQRDPITADLGQLQKYLLERDQNVELVRSEVGLRPGIRYGELYYEDFVGEHRVRDLRRLFAALDLPSQKTDVNDVIRAIQEGEVRVNKPISLDRCRDRFVNWDEVREAMLRQGRKDEVRYCELNDPIEFGS